MTWRSCLEDLDVAAHALTLQDHQFFRLDSFAECHAVRVTVAVEFAANHVFSGSACCARTDKVDKTALLLLQVAVSICLWYLQAEVNQGLQEGLEVLKQQKALAEALAEGRGQEVQGLKREVQDLIGRLTEAESRVQQGELIRRKLHNTILVSFAASVPLPLPVLHVGDSVTILKHVHSLWYNFVKSCPAAARSDVCIATQWIFQ